MALLNQSIQVPGQLATVFRELQQGQAPEKFSRQFLKDKGFLSSNYHALIPLFKGLGFISTDGSPTQRYRDLLDSTKTKVVIAEAIKEAYSDIFVLKNRPTKADKKIIIGKYKTQYNMSETTADRAATTFLALLELADEEVLYGPQKEKREPQRTSEEAPEAAPHNAPDEHKRIAPKSKVEFPLHYNIQIHLPATKDLEVYNAIFKSLKEHIFE